MPKLTILALLFATIFTGIMFPYGFPLFSLCLLPVLFFEIMKKKSFMLPKVLWPLLVIEGIHILAFLFTEDLYGYMKKELTHIILIDAYVLLLFMNIKNRDQLKAFFKKCENIMLTVCVVISSLGFYKFFLLLQGQTLAWVQGKSAIYPWGTTLVRDYNSFALGLSIGLIYALNKLENSKSTFNVILLLAITALITGCMLASGSRRGFICATIIFGYYISKWILHWIKRKTFNYKKLLITGAIILLTLIGVKTYTPELEINTGQIDTLINRASTLFDGSDITSSRTRRWQLTYDIINNQTNPIHILFGNGFNYIGLFNQTFSETSGQDYPHNIILSAMLHSGILGATLLTLFLIQSSYIIFKHRHNYFDIYIFFLLTLFYLLTSSNTLFTSKVSLLLVSLPYLIYTIENHEEKN